MVDDSSADPRDKVMSNLDYSLQLLFLATQVDMRWSAQTDERREKERPVTLKRKSGQVMLIPRLKKSFLSILKATKYRLANTCLPCARQSSKESVLASDESCLKTKENDKLMEKNYNVEGRKTLIYTDDYSIPSQEKVLEEEDPPVVLLQTIADGRQCFQESRQFASRGIQEVKNLSDTVSSIQKSLQFALDQLSLIEYGLNDCRWESVDRETWTQSHFLSSVGTITSLWPDVGSRARSRSRLSLNSDVLFCDLDYSWID